MKNGGVLVWVLFLVALLIVGAQWSHYGKAKKRAAERTGPSTPSGKAFCTPVGTQSPIIVFGREYSYEQVQSWFSKVNGRYCYREGTVYAFGSAPGDAFTFEEFVCALKQGHYFPELSGEGVKSDGEKVILQHTGFRRPKETSHKAYLAN